MTRRPPIRHIDPTSFELSDDARALRDKVPVERPLPPNSGVNGLWFAAHVSPSQRSAERVEEFMDRLGFETYWPKVHKLKKRPGRGDGDGPTSSRYLTKVISTPLLPRYITVLLPAEDAPFGAFRTPEALANGLCGLVRSISAGPLIIPTNQIDELKRREAAGEFNMTTRHGRKLIAKRPDWATVGAVVRVDDGPFRGFNATIEELIAADRAKVSVSIFGRATPVELGLDQISQGRGA